MLLFLQQSSQQFCHIYLYTYKPSSIFDIASKYIKVIPHWWQNDTKNLMFCCWSLLHKVLISVILYVLSFCNKTFSAYTSSTLLIIHNENSYKRQLKGFISHVKWIVTYLGNHFYIYLNVLFTMKNNQINCSMEVMIRRGMKTNHRIRKSFSLRTLMGRTQSPS